MRDVFVGGTGMVLGGLLGVGGTVVLEGLLVGAVAATLFFTTGSPDAAPAPVAVNRTATTQRAPVSEPGELQLMTMAAVQPLVDGIPMGFDPMQGFLVQLPEGTHRVQILDVLARPVATSDVVVVAGQRTQLRWAKKELADLGRVPMLGAATVRTTPPPTPVPPVAPVAPVVVDLQIDQALADVDAAMAEVEGQTKAIEAVANGILSLTSGDGLKIPKLGRRLGKAR